MNLRRTTLAIAMAALVPSFAGAQLVQTGRLEATGGGLGAQLTLLTLQNPAGTSTEQGCVTPTAFTCALNGATFLDASVQQGQSQVQLLSQAALSGLTGENVRLVLNLSEPNSSPAEALGILQDMRLLLFNSSGDILFQSVGITTPLTLESPGAGIGNFGFTFALSGGDIMAFNNALAAGAVSVGVAARLTEVTGGLETIAIARATTVIPEPSTYALMSAGLLGLYAVARRRRRNA